MERFKLLREKGRQRLSEINQAIFNKHPSGRERIEAILAIYNYFRSAIFFFHFSLVSLDDYFLLLLFCFGFGICDFLGGRDNEEEA